jgi:hypothetical protein
MLSLNQEVLPGLNESSRIAALQHGSSFGTNAVGA